MGDHLSRHPGGPVHYSRAAMDARLLMALVHAAGAEMRGEELAGRAGWTDAGGLAGGRGRTGASQGNASAATSVSHYRCYGGASGVEVTSTSVGVRDGRTGETVTETRRTYRDSTGYEKLGVARTLGNRGRDVVRERDASGAERARDTLHGLGEAEKAAFDREWRERAEAVRLGAGASALRLSARPPPPTLEEREAARAGRRAFEEQTQRVVEEARRVRATATQPPSRRAPQTPASTANYARRLAAEENERLWR